MSDIEHDIKSTNKQIVKKQPNTLKKWNSQTGYCLVPLKANFPCYHAGYVQIKGALRVAPYICGWNPDGINYLVSINRFETEYKHQYVGTSTDGYPVLLLDLPSFFQTERDDISEEYSLFVKVNISHVTWLLSRLPTNSLTATVSLWMPVVLIIYHFRMRILT